MILSQSSPNYFPFLLSSLPLKLHFGHFPLFFSFYIQLFVLFLVFLLRVPCLLDIFPIFLPYMSNFHFYFLSSFSDSPGFWIFFLFFFHLCPIFTSISCLPSPGTLSFGYFPYFSSIYVQFSLRFLVFLLRVPCLLDIFLFFLQHMSNFHFDFLSSFSGYPVFWTFSFSFFNICPIFTSISCLPSPGTLSFGHFPYFSSIYVQFSFLFFVFLLRVPCLLDIFLIFLPFMSNFHFYFLSSFSGYPVFWTFSLSFFHICPIFHRSPTIELPVVTKFGYIAIRSALYVQSISVNT